ncbi:MAG: ABC transporter permease [Acidibrevibacterium sp.]|jgi:lipopolysaccharide transport system permease protein|uniref:ABC transporter permease n=1 Tax=Acidibrevibacterium fodinaquatile TaxID=1969806 RepID=UPI000E0D9C12|nr:ABC transporter permease [Acidibrevibacterium fodinaquatile]MCA7120508.1 ABC transporter permease [Acidibrevibacterium fodinaquatile]
MSNPADSHLAAPPAALRLKTSGDVVLDLVAGLHFAGRQRLAIADFVEATRLWRLGVTLAWLDVKGRYRGSMLGPLWLTLSTAVMVAAMGVLYSTLFKMVLHDYLPFLALSLVLWGYLQTLVAEASLGYTQNDAMIRAVRMPFSLYGGRIVLRNLIVLGHNIIVIVVVFAIFDTWPGMRGLIALPGLALWLIDSLAITMTLAALCARFRDIPPIVGSVMQIAFFISPVIWRPELIRHGARFLPINPFYALFEIVRAPLLGEIPGAIIWGSAIAYSVLLVVLSWLLFVRVRGRLAFWV